MKTISFEDFFFCPSRPSPCGVGIQYTVYSTSKNNSGKNKFGAALSSEEMVQSFHIAPTPIRGFCASFF